MIYLEQSVFQYSRHSTICLLVTFLCLALAPLHCNFINEKMYQSIIIHLFPSRPTRCHVMSHCSGSGVRGGGVRRPGPLIFKTSKTRVFLTRRQLFLIVSLGVTVSYLMWCANCTTPKARGRVEGHWRATC